MRLTLLNFGIVNPGPVLCLIQMFTGRLCPESDCARAGQFFSSIGGGVPWDRLA